VRFTTGFAEPTEVRLHPLVMSKRCQCLAENLDRAGVAGNDNSVVHPLSLAPRGNHTGAPQICQVTRNLGLALPENLDEVANAHFPAIHQVQQPEPGAIGERGKQERQIEGLRGAFHSSMIYALTDVSSESYIRFSVYEEARSWSRAFRNR